MKFKLLFILVLSLIATCLQAQDLVEPNKPYPYLDSAPGYITFNEATYGFSTGNTGLNYSKSYYGFTTIHGYQIDRYFMAGAGIGVSFYERETVVPLFMHIRFSFKGHPLAPIIFTDGGLLFENQSRTVVFINPGLGIRYTLNHKLAINFGTGLFVLSGTSMDSFVSFRLGIIFKPPVAVNTDRTKSEKRKTKNILPKNLL